MQSGRTSNLEQILSIKHQLNSSAFVREGVSSIEKRRTIQSVPAHISSRTPWFADAIAKNSLHSDALENISSSNPSETVAIRRSSKSER